MLSAAFIGLCISSLVLFTNLSKEKVRETPIGLWCVHIASCCFSGIIYHKTNINEAPFVLWIASFLAISFDASLYKLWAQTFSFFGICVLIILKIGLLTIMSHPHGIGWLIILFICLLTTLPILVGMRFFWVLSKKEFPVFAISILISMDYFIGLIIAGIIVSHLS